MAFQFSVNALNGALNGIEAAVGVAPSLEIRSGTVPANCAAADAGTLLASMTLPNDWLTDAASAVKGKAGTWRTEAATAGGTAGHFRVKAGATTHMQGTVTGLNGGGDVRLQNVVVEVDQPVEIVEFNLGAAGNLDPVVLIAGGECTLSGDLTADGTVIISPSLVGGSGPFSREFRVLQGTISASGVTVLRDWSAAISGTISGIADGDYLWLQERVSGASGDQITISAPAGFGPMVGGAPGYLSSVSVEDNGWVLRVEGTWPASTFASFDLDPSGAPKVSIATTSTGFARSGSEPIAGAARARSGVVCTKPLRRPYPDHALLDETDLGGGVRRVRLAMSRYVYPGDPVTVTFAAGWRAALDGGTTAATNNSTHAVRIPSARWATPSYLIENGAFRIDLLVSNIEAEGRSAVAAVKVIGYDGTNTQEWWLTESVSNRFGDNLKCWGATINPTALTAGVITLHWEVYPWIGAVRRSGTAHDTDPEGGLRLAADACLHVCWDPAGTRYPARHIYIDPAGTTTPGDVTIGATLAAAKAGTAAANQFVALQALHANNYTLPAANGFAGGSRSADGATMTFSAATHSFVAGSNTSGLGTYEARVIWRGDPDDANPRANVILQTVTSASLTVRITRSLMQNMSLELGGSMPLSVRWHWDNCEIRGRVGDEAATGGIASSVAAGYARFSATNSRFWKWGATLSGGGFPFSMFRNVEFNRGVQAPVVCTSTRIEDTTVPAGARASVTAQSGITDGMIWGVRSFYSDNSGFLFSDFSNGGTPAAPARRIRGNIVNSIFERITNGSGNNADPFFSSDNNVTVEDCLLEGSTFVGQRVNWGYNGPTDNITNIVSTGNCVRNCHFDRLPTKHDVFTLNGNLVAGWSNLYGVNNEGLTVIQRGNAIPEPFEFEFHGLRSFRITTFAANPDNLGNFIFTDAKDAHSLQGSVLGGGNYLPTASSPLLSRGIRACIDVDVLGTARGSTFDAGAIERT